MLAYFSVYWMSALAALSLSNKRIDRSRLLWWTCFVALVLFAGLRFEVGGDWRAYLFDFRKADGIPFAAHVRLTSDPLYWTLNWIVSNFGLGFAILNTICAALCIGGVMSLARTQPLPWLALAIALPYIIFIVGMGFVRQSVALGFLAWALVALERGRVNAFLGLVTIGAMFHLSGAVFYLLALRSLSRLRWWHFMIGVAVGLPVFQSLFLAKFSEAYLYYLETGRSSAGAEARLAINVPAALLILFFRDRLGLGTQEHRHWLFIALAVLALVPALSFASTSVDRFAIYLTLIQPVVYSRVPFLFAGPQMRAVSIAGFVLVYWGILYVWMNYADHADSWVPYQNYLFL